MAKNVIINGVSYQAVPSVNIPLADGSGSAKFVETSDATASTNSILKGETAYGADGSKITGSLTCAQVSQDSSTKVVTIS